MQLHEDYIGALRLVNNGQCTEVQVMDLQELVHWKLVAFNRNTDVFELTADGSAHLSAYDEQKARYRRMESISHLGDLLEDLRVDAIKYQDWWDAWQETGVLQGLCSASPVSVRGEIFQHVAKLIVEANEMGLRGQEIDHECSADAVMQVEKELGK